MSKHLFPDHEGEGDGKEIEWDCVKLDGLGNIYFLNKMNQKNYISQNLYTGFLVLLKSENNLVAVLLFQEGKEKNKPIEWTFWGKCNSVTLRGGHWIVREKQLISILGEK